MYEKERYIELEIPSELLEGGTKPVKYFISMRVSTDKQTNDRQEAELNTFLPTLPRNFKHAGSYEDKTSGKNFNRPEYKKMVKALRANQAKVVICWDMTRFSRSVLDFHKQITLFRKLGVHLYLVKEHLIITPEDNSFQNLITNILTSMAQFQRETIVENTTEGMRAKAAANPFMHYGNFPKIRGRQWRTLVHMYYAKKDDPKHGKGKWNYAFTLADIANHFGVSKPAISDLVGKHVKIGTLVLRSPDMRRKAGTIGSTKLVIPEAQKVRATELSEKKLANLLHPKYWPIEVREKVSAKFGGNYAKKQSHKAYEYGKKLYQKWLVDTAKSAGKHAEQVEIRAIVPGSKIDSRAEFVKALELALEQGY